ncbi:hypothetical protein BZG36_00577 [Bifiguratus adelaidae]|uniref:KH type-2 domain-containing protein n=1 Tax=Bifiguratus adelaidae TaxID=1938954 RepID=A0A261Y733_9FUNG|nr:hypothetical protein BZG36_00577 [Bifiguratus adelaidae]
MKFYEHVNFRIDIFQEQYSRRRWPDTESCRGILRRAPSSPSKYNDKHLSTAGSRATPKEPAASTAGEGTENDPNTYRRGDPVPRPDTAKESKRQETVPSEDVRKLIGDLSQVPKGALLFGFTGTIPYVATSIFSIQYANHPEIMTILEPVQIGYGACIISFLGAIHWGLEIGGYNGSTGLKRYTLGVIPPLFAWPTLFLQPQYALWTQFVGFIGLLWLDVRAVDRGWAPRWYTWLRYWLTGIVGGSIILTIMGKERMQAKVEGHLGRKNYGFYQKDEVGGGRKTTAGNAIAVSDEETESEEPPSLHQLGSENKRDEGEQERMTKEAKADGDKEKSTKKEDKGGKDDSKDNANKQADDTKSSAKETQSKDASERLVRQYAIMTRIKRMAGKQPNKPVKNSTKLSSESPASVHRVIEQTPLKQVVYAPKVMPPSCTRSPVQSTGVQTKVAEEKLAPVVTDFEQPADPYLLKVALVGAANAGKSTLLNGILGEKVSIVSSKAHTTRERTLGILSKDNMQIVFYDTPGVIPGINKAKLNRQVVNTAWQTLKVVDHVMVIIDVQRLLNAPSMHTEEYLFRRLAEYAIAVTILVNKMDTVKDKSYSDTEREADERLRAMCPTVEKVFYMSALESEDVHKIKASQDTLLKLTKPHSWLYPATQTVDMARLKRVEEFIREELYSRLEGYLPYSIVQENVGWTPVEGGGLRIDQNIYVERPSQQKIVVGSGGKVINGVTHEARKQITKAFAQPVHLFLHVKCRNKLMGDLMTTPMIHASGHGQPLTKQQVSKLMYTLRTRLGLAGFKAKHGMMRSRFNRVQARFSSRLPADPVPCLSRTRLAYHAMSRRSSILRDLEMSRQSSARTPTHMTSPILRRRDSSPCTEKSSEPCATPPPRFAYPTPVTGNPETDAAYLLVMLHHSPLYPPGEQKRRHSVEFWQSERLQVPQPLKPGTSAPMPYVTDPYPRPAPQIHPFEAFMQLEKPTKRQRTELPSPSPSYHQRPPQFPQESFRPRALPAYPTALYAQPQPFPPQRDVLRPAPFPPPTFLPSPTCPNFPPPLQPASSSIASSPTNLSDGLPAPCTPSPPKNQPLTPPELSGLDSFRTIDYDKSWLTEEFGRCEPGKHVEGCNCKIELGAICYLPEKHAFAQHKTQCADENIVKAFWNEEGPLHVSVETTGAGVKDIGEYIIEILETGLSDDEDECESKKASPPATTSDHRSTSLDTTGSTQLTSPSVSDVHHIHQAGRSDSIASGTLSSMSSSQMTPPNFSPLMNEHGIHIDPGMSLVPDLSALATWSHKIALMDGQPKMLAGDANLWNSTLQPSLADIYPFGQQTSVNTTPPLDLDMSLIEQHPADPSNFPEFDPPFFTSTPVYEPQAQFDQLYAQLGLMFQQDLLPAPVQLQQL